MMSSTFGAPSGGTTRGGHQEVDSLAVSLIEPPNAAASAAFAVDKNNCLRFILLILIFLAFSLIFLSVLLKSCAAHSGIRCGSLSCQSLADSAPRAYSAGSNWARRDTSRP